MLSRIDTELDNGDGVVETLVEPVSIERYRAYGLFAKMKIFVISRSHW